MIVGVLNRGTRRLSRVSWLGWLAQQDRCDSCCFVASTSYSRSSKVGPRKAEGVNHKRWRRRERAARWRSGAGL